MAEDGKAGRKGRKKLSLDDEEKKKIIEKVASSKRPTAETLRGLGISRSTYYSWVNRFKEEESVGMGEDLEPKTDKEDKDDKEDRILAEARITSAQPQEESAEDTAPGSAPADGAIKQPAKEHNKEVPLVTTSTGSKQAPGLGQSGGSSSTNFSAIATLAVIFIIAGLIISLCMHNSSRYFIEQKDGEVSLWKGRFAPFGKEIVEDFAPIAVGSSDISPLVDKSYYGKWAAISALFSHMITQADKMLEESDTADFSAANQYLSFAEKIAASSQQKDILSKRYANFYNNLADKKIVKSEQDLLRVYEGSLTMLDQAVKLNPEDAEVLEAKIQVLLAKIEELQAWNSDFEESWLAQRSESPVMEKDEEGAPAEAEQTGVHTRETTETEAGEVLEKAERKTAEPTTEKDAAAELAEKVLELIRTNTQSEGTSK